MAADLEMHLSGGAANTSPASALGGARSTAGGGVVPEGATANSLFDNITSTEEAAGDVEYRGVYLYNAGTVDAESVVAYLSANTPDADTSIAIAVADEAVNVAMETIANESTAPVGPAFSSPATEGAGIAIGTIPAGQARGLWVRRTVNAGAGASDDTFTIAAAFDTAA